MTVIFSYVETHTFLVENDKTASLVIKGECTADPYIFTQEIVEGDAIWSECYIYQEDDAYKCVVMVDGVWQEAKAGQDAPIFSGYEERNDIKILSKKEKSLDDTSDLNRANNIAISMYSSGDTMEEATEKANKQASETKVEVEITYIDENYVLEIPEATK